MEYEDETIGERAIACPAQQANCLQSPAMINITPEMTDCGNTIHETSASTLAPIAIASNLKNDIGSRPGLFRVSQLSVKLGTIRPPTNEMSATMAAMPRRAPYSALPY